MPEFCREISSVGYIGCSFISPSFSIDIIGMRVILREAEAEITFRVFEHKADQSKGKLVTEHKDAEKP